MRLQEFLAQQTKPACKVCDTLPHEVLAEVNEALQQGAPCQTIARWIRQEGHAVGYTTVRTHKERCVG